jgi:hypothetical protein
MAPWPASIPVPRHAATRAEPWRERAATAAAADAARKQILHSYVHRGSAPIIKPVSKVQVQLPHCLSGRWEEPTSRDYQVVAVALSTATATATAAARCPAWSSPCRRHLLAVQGFRKG